MRLLFLLLPACRTWPPPSVDARTFDANAKAPMRVVRFPPVCRALDGGCENVDIGGPGRGYRDGVDVGARCLASAR